MAPLVLIHIAFEDLDRAARFYVRAFGLVVGRRLGPEVVELIGAERPIHLRAERRSAGAGRRHPPVQLDLRVDDLEATLARARQAGAVPEGRVREHAWGRIAQLADPFGNRICLLEFGRAPRGCAEAAAAWQAGPAPGRARPRGTRQGREGRWDRAC